jgi:hypothetical protein
MGVFFVDKDNIATPVTHRLLQNDPKKVIVRVPETLASGEEYRLQIVTRFTNGKILLKVARSIIYSQNLKVL